MNKTRNILGCAVAASLLAACNGGTSSIPTSQSAPQPIVMGGTQVVSPYALRDERGRIVPHAHVMLTRAAAQHVLEAFHRRGGAGNNLSYHGGPIQSTPSVYVVFWGFGTYGDPSGEQSYMTNFLNNVGGSSWLNIDHQYYQKPGKLLCSSTGKQTYCVGNPASQLKGTWNDDSPVPSSPDDAAIAAEAVNLANHFGGADPNASYVVATPTGHNSSGFGTQWCGYHSYNGILSYTDIGYITDAGYGCGQNFINQGPAGNNDGISIIGGHELAETQTDPQPGSGWVDLRGLEMADKCAWSSMSADVSFGGSTLGTNEFPVQPLWSNALSGCALSY